MNKSAVAIAVFAALTPAWQTQAAAPADSLAACGEVTDSQARLQCFDRELAKSRPAAATPPRAAASSAAPASAVPPAAAPAAASTIAPAAAASAAASFGNEQLALKDQQKVEELRVMHASLSSQKELGSSRTYNLFLDNGQVWRHENSHLGSYLREGEAITITKASGLGAYRLTRDAGSPKDWIRVTRVR